MLAKSSSLSTIDNSNFVDKWYAPAKDLAILPDLNSLQVNSYQWFIKEGLKELFEEISPVEDLTGKNLELHFVDYYLDESKVDEDTSRNSDMTYEASLRVKLRLINKETGEIKEQEVFLGDIPVMTAAGAFIINGIERVVISQLIRSAGVLFTRSEGLTHGQYGTKIIPERGAWLEIETNNKGILTVKIDRKRKTYLTTLLRAFGLGSDSELIEAFKDVNTNPKMDYIQTTIDRDPTKSSDQAILEVYKKMRPGDLATVDNARNLFHNVFMSLRRYDLSSVGRYKLNKRLKLDLPNNKEFRVLTIDDLVAITKEIIRLNNEGGPADDVDNLKNRRVKAVGELVLNRFRTGMMRVERIVKDRMSVSDIHTVTPAQLINARPITAILQEFFGSSQLSQFMDQTNPLSELENKRRMSAMGPGGLSHERAGFEVRDVHSSHYGRICPIQTPEGPNIGLVMYLSSLARVNHYGFIETPYHKIIHEVANDGKSLVGHVLFKDIVAPGSTKVLVSAGQLISTETAEMLTKYKDITVIPIKSRILDHIDYLDVYSEEKALIAQPNISQDENGVILCDRVIAREGGGGDPLTTSVGHLDYVDVSARQTLSIAASLIPFIEHDDARRALMGANMQRQAVPLVKPQVPLVGTGMEGAAAVGSGWVITAPVAGTIKYVDANRIDLVGDKDSKTHTFKLANFRKSNAETVLHQSPIVNLGQKVTKGQALCNGPAISNGKLALGRNLLVAFMPWGGANYEDAIILSDNLVKEDVYTSIHIKRQEIDVRETKLGPEITTRDIPNVGEDAVADLDEDGVVRIGARVKANDILVGKITPKGETELTAEERLLRAIFGEKVKDVKDTSLKLPHGGYGKVVAVKIFDHDKGDKLEVGVIKRIYVYIAQMRKISVGDKLSGRHGNKGVISRIMPAADMSFMADGTPVDIILNPLGVVSRMNLGQVLETHLGWAAAKQGFNSSNPVFEGIDMDGIVDELKKAGLPEDGKIQLFDGLTGDAFDQKTMVGMIYMLKLNHMVDDKIHARSIGPYALVTQQPLGGKAQLGGQRVGEMEVWALEGYGAAHILQEMLTIKSDDVLGRSNAYKSIIRGEEIQKPQTPEAFNVIAKELQGLGLNIELLDADGKSIGDSPAPRKFRKK
ncbi:MAG: DNA-directed RNA polymerase subunit beta [Patescibacteria group bacterium]